MKKPLDKIQIVFKIAKILCSILFVFAVIGAVGSLFALFFLAYGIDVNTEVIMDGKTVLDFISGEIGFEINAQTLYLILIIAAVSCIVESILCQLGKNYFRRELEDGTPFTEKNSKGLRKLGIIYLVTPLARELFFAILVAVVRQYATIQNNAISSSAFDFSFSLGLFFIILSFFCEYGASLQSSDSSATYSVDSTDNDKTE